MRNAKLINRTSAICKKNKHIKSNLNNDIVSYEMFLKIFKL